MTAPAIGQHWQSLDQVRGQRTKRTVKVIDYVEFDGGGRPTVFLVRTVLDHDGKAAKKPRHSHVKAATLADHYTLVPAP